ncbi:protein WVD2-like 7 isoform X2 [Juglans microcarpa x Juglans regia]|uniref:protein WVD2-like 7 isoform X2 n=1 Tax=Juglans microcarpa x Juglans regia TaxID=2249226 RepID=UPI001B7E8392|nr:protein WVD2-like 7 isoform X2 [Juglans microcarpa x Juglans regia]
MAGDIEESYSFGLQADSLHSGSISFGRFEKESLSWERRSSFSHNRYLEEVAKCSKPGSVIEKKAYFEAHFKKKGLLRPNSSEFHNEKEYQTSENDVLESREESGHVNEGRHFAHFDESPEGSEYQGEYEVTGNETENPEVPFSVPEMEPALNSADILVAAAEDVNAEETQRTETGLDKLLSVKDESEMHGLDNFLSVNDEPEIKVNQTLNDDAVNADESSKALVNDEPVIEVNQDLDCDIFSTENSPKDIDPSPKTGPSVKSEETHLEHGKYPSPKLRAAMEMGALKPKEKCRANLALVLTDISGAGAKDPAKNPNRRERESTLRTNQEKNSVKTDIPTTPAMQKSPILEDSRSQKAKLMQDNKSGEKDSRRKKVGEYQPFPTKAETRGHQAPHRLNHTVNSTKADVRSGAAAFSFKSDERAERRKEFYTKLEQKMHAKEAEMNQVQARTQEKTEAEIKQFRRSLNFKATPMPSFYHAAVSPGSDGKKAQSSNNKVNKARNKYSPGSRAAGSSKSCLKEGNDQALSTCESVNTTEPIDASEATNCPTGEDLEVTAASQAPYGSQSCSPEATAGNEISGRKERVKERDTSVHKHHVSESHKVMKGRKVEGKQKTGGQRSSKEIAKKDMKGIGIGSGSQMSNLAVGVAS